MIKKICRSTILGIAIFSVGLLFLIGSRVIVQDHPVLAVALISISFILILIFIQLRHSIQTHAQVNNNQNDITLIPKIVYLILIALLSVMTQYNIIGIGALLCIIITIIYQHLLTCEKHNLIHVALCIKTYTSHFNLILYPILCVSIMYQSTNLPPPLFIKTPQLAVNINHPNCTVMHNGQKVFTSTLKPNEYKKYIPAGTYFANDCLQPS